MADFASELMLRSPGAVPIEISDGGYAGVDEIPDHQGYLTTIAALSRIASLRHGSRIAARFKTDDVWQERSFEDLDHDVGNIARGLLGAGLLAGDRICILADTSYRWTCINLAIASAGCVTVPIFPASTPSDCHWVLANSSVRAVFCQSRDQLAKISTVRTDLPDLEFVFAIDPDDPPDWVTSMDDLLACGTSLDNCDLTSRSHSVEPEDLCSIIYTSGTTGPPKGVVLTHANCSSLAPIIEELQIVTPDDVAYLFLPLAHVLAQTVQFAALYIGVTVVYYGGNPNQIVNELQEVRPTYFPTVPRVLEKIYSSLIGMFAADPESEELLRSDIRLGSEVRTLQANGQEIPEELAHKYEEADERLYSAVRSIFGGRIRESVTGAAPIAPEILEFFYSCGITILEGWGMTETTGIASMSTRDCFRIGSVGRPIPDMSVKIASDGEILVRGKGVFREYWQDEVATRSAFTDDGWLKTGDLGELDKDGFLSILGRKKEILITSGGKKLAPSNIENDLRQSRWISQAIMFADRMPYPVAILTLAPDALLPWARTCGLPESMADLARSPEVQRMIQAEVDLVNQRYPLFAQVKRFAILGHDFTSESGDLTITQKLRRDAIYARYASVFESLYMT